MREVPVSNCEKQFVLKCIEAKKRIDGRRFLDGRKITLTFKSDYGCCIATLGNTKVMAQVVAEMDRPKESRSSEGILGIFVEMSTMASPGFDPSKPGELGAELQRMLERSIMLSKAVDLEELCVRVGEQAWRLSVHVQILSHDGNLLDCAVVACHAALAHFKRPDVTTSGKEVTVHTFEEKHPVSLVINHQPFFVTFAFFGNGNSCILDPTRIEETCADGRLMISLNKHREVCCTQMSGNIRVRKEDILQCTNLASNRAKELSAFIKSAIENDNAAKSRGEKTSTMSSSARPAREEDDLKVHSGATSGKVSVPEKSEEMEEGPTEGAGDEEKLCWVMEKGEGTVSIGEEKNGKSPKKVKNVKMASTDSDSEEETQVVLQLG